MTDAPIGMTPEQVQEMIERPIVAINPVQDVEAVVVPDETLTLQSPIDTKGWVVTRQDGIETFTNPHGTAFARARPDEDADVIVVFTRTRGMTPLRLIERGESATVRRAERKKRRENAELRKRGYDV